MYSAFRLASLTALGIAGLWPGHPTLPGAGSATVPPTRAADMQVLGTVARSLTSPSGAVEQLAQSRTVKNATLGSDGRTVEIIFRDGTRAAILPGASELTQVTGRVSPLASSHDDSLGPAGRAEILEPFATELQLNPSIDDPEIASLQNAGFSVDRLVDADVTVEAMLNLDRYRVLYLNTHTGVNQYGEGIIATGELANGDPTAEAMVKEGTAYIVGVSGSDGHYYGVISSFFLAHLGQFPAGSMMFVNGCSLLRATRVWDALATRGMGAFISWDDYVDPPGDTTAAALVFADLSTGRTVQQAVASAFAQGFGVMQIEGHSAQLGWRGDGSLTWAPPTPTPVPSSTATPQSTPTATTTPVPSTTTSPTSTPRPTAVAVRDVHFTGFPGIRKY
jgi:hypothetical protein